MVTIKVETLGNIMEDMDRMEVESEEQNTRTMVPRIEPVAGWSQEGVRRKIIKDI